MSTTEQERYDNDFEYHRNWLIEKQVYLARLAEQYKATEGRRRITEEQEETPQREEFEAGTIIKNPSELTHEANIAQYEGNWASLEAGHTDLGKYFPYQDGFENNFPEAVPLYKKKDKENVPG